MNEKRIAASEILQQAIEELSAEGLHHLEKLTELGRLGARLVLQRAVEDEATEFLGRARYERTPTARGSRNGVRPQRVQTAEGELPIQMPQLRNTAERFVCQVIPETRTVIRPRALEALVIGAYVRGLSERDIESLLEEAGLGKLSKSTASRICRELKARYQAFRARSLTEVDLMVLFLDAIYLPTRPSGAKEGVLVAWGYRVTGERVFLNVCLGQRERWEDWLELGRGLTRRGLRSPWLVVADGAPGLIQGHRRVVAGCGSPALYGASAAQHRGPTPQAGTDPGAGQGGLLGGPRRGPLGRRRRATPAGIGERARAGVPQRGRLPGGGPTGPGRAPAVSPSAASSPAQHQPLRAIAG